MHRMEIDGLKGMDGLEMGFEEMDLTNFFGVDNAYFTKCKSNRQTSNDPLHESYHII